MKVKRILALITAAMTLFVTGCDGQTSPSQTGNSTPSEPEKEYSYVQLGDVRYRIEEGTDLYFNGRWFDKEIDGVTVKASTNNGAEIYFMVSGTESVTLHCPNNGNMENTTPILAYCIDGATFDPVRVTVENDQVIIPLPDNGHHIVRVITESRNAGGDKWNTGCGYAVSSVDAGEGTVVGVKPMNKTIAFYGDSITEGDFVYNLDWNKGSSATYTYAWQTAVNLGAVPYTCGYGSSGVMQDGFFKDALTAVDWMTNSVSDPGAEDPAVIVINHGANDQNYADADVTVNYKKLIERLHEKHPNAVIVAVAPFGQFKVPAIQAAVADYDYAHFVSTKGWPMAYTDGLHPNVQGAKNAGKKLAEAITAIVGEDYFNE